MQQWPKWVKRIKLMLASLSNNPAGIYLLKVNNRNTRKRCEICSKLTIKTPEQRQWRRCGVFIVNFKLISHLVLAFLLWTLNMQFPAWNKCCNNNIAKYLNVAIVKYQNHIKIQYLLPNMDKNKCKAIKLNRTQFNSCSHENQIKTLITTPTESVVMVTDNISCTKLRKLQYTKESLKNICAATNDRGHILTQMKIVQNCKYCRTRPPKKIWLLLVS